MSSASPINQVDDLKNDLRKYGQGPFAVPVPHGEPGAPGEVAPLARELSRGTGVREPLRTATSLDGQVDELLGVLDEHADLPATLIGHPWGALLGFIFAGRHPGHVRKLILVGSAAFEERYAAQIDAVRIARLAESDRQEVASLLAGLDDPTNADKAAHLRRLGQIFARAAAYDPLPHSDEVTRSSPISSGMSGGKRVSCGPAGSSWRWGSGSAAPSWPSTATTTRTRRRASATLWPRC